MACITNCNSFDREKQSTQFRFSPPYLDLARYENVCECECACISVKVLPIPPFAALVFTFHHVFVVVYECVCVCVCVCCAEELLLDGLSLSLSHLLLPLVAIVMLLHASTLTGTIEPTNQRENQKYPCTHTSV